MELKAGTRIRLKHGTVYDHQPVRHGERYEGTIVATADQGVQGHSKINKAWLSSGFDAKVVWDWAQNPLDPDASYYYNWDDLVALSADNNEDALTFLNKEEAW